MWYVVEAFVFLYFLYYAGKKIKGLRLEITYLHLFLRQVRLVLCQCRPSDYEDNEDLRNEVDYFVYHIDEIVEDTTPVWWED